MSDKPDIAVLAGRTLGAVLDEIGPWSGNLGYRRSGPITIASMMAPSNNNAPSEAEEAAQAALQVELDALFGPIELGAVVLVDATGTEIPVEVWLSGNWILYRDGRAVVRLVWTDANSNKTVFYNPRFATLHQHGRVGRLPADSPEDIARGVELARLYRGNASRAARDLYDKDNPQPPLNVSRAERDRWARNRDQHIKRLAAHISKKLKES